MKKNNMFRLFSLIVLLILLVIIVVQNLSPVDVSFIVPLGKQPVITVILISLLIGYILGLITYSLLFRGAKTKAEKSQTAEKTNIEKTKQGK